MQTSPAGHAQSTCVMFSSSTWIRNTWDRGAGLVDLLLHVVQYCEWVLGHQLKSWHRGVSRWCSIIYPLLDRPD